MGREAFASVSGGPGEPRRTHGEVGEIRGIELPRVGGELRLGDVVEEVYLNAFERFPRRPADVRLSAWLEGLVEPSIRALMQHPDEERQPASFARTVREAALP